MKILILLLTCNICFAEKYYVSNTGNDANDGLTISTPFLSIQKVNTIDFFVGDSVFFKAGDTFYGTIAATKNGVIYSRYGTGVKPIITGFTDVTAWTNVGGNIWESTTAVSTLSTCNMVVINGVNTPVGKTPNIGYFTVATQTGKTSLTSGSLNGGTNWTGAEAVIKTTDWTINRSVISSQSGNLINIDGTQLFYDIKPNYGFFIQKDIRTLDTSNEWYFNPVTRKLSIFSLSMPTSVKVGTVENLFWINGVLSNITIKDIAFEGSNGSAIFRNTTLSAAINSVIKNCSINFSGLSAIEVKVNKVLVDSNIISNSNDMAISAQYCKNVTISNNLISNSGTIPGMGKNGNAFSAVAFGLLIDSRSIVTYNTITNTGHNPITFGIDTAFIAYNKIDSFNTIIDDGGGIYGGSNATVSSNFVSNGIGSNSGTARNALSNGLVVGIYIDDLGANNTIINNSVFNIGWVGIYLHSARFNNVKSNTVYNAGTAQLLLKSDAASGSVRGNTIKNNLFVAKEISQRTADFKSQFNDLDSIGLLDSNIYARPFDNVLTLESAYKIGSTTFNRQLDINDWKLQYNKDENSTAGAVVVSPYSTAGTIVNNKISNGLFTSNVIGVGISTSAGSTVSYDNTKLDTGSAKIIALDNAGISMLCGGIDNNKKYLLHFSAISNIDFNLEIYIRKRTSPSNTLSEVKLIKIHSTRKEYEVVFSDPSFENDALLILNIKSNPVIFNIDNIVFTEAVVSPILSTNVFRFEYNYTNNAKLVEFVGLSYNDVVGTVYNNSITIPSWGSRILIANGTTYNPLKMYLITK